MCSFLSVFILLITQWSLTHSNKETESSISSFSVDYGSPVDTDVYCLDPGGIMFGQRKPVFKHKLALPMGSQIHFVCWPGYELDGYNKMICNKMGNWEPPTKPQCRPVFCLEPRIDHGTIRSSNSGAYYSGTTVQVVCDAGYRLRDKSNEMMECDLNGSWVSSSGQFMFELPSCNENTCSQPPQIPNSKSHVKGDIGWDGGYRQNSIVTYQCNHGYQIEDLQGSRLVCTNCKWQPEHPNVPLSKCVQGGCSKPFPIPNGKFVPQLSEIYPYGALITYFCDMGYTPPLQPLVFQCMFNGLWSPPMRNNLLPTCQMNQGASCLQPPYVPHGHIVKINGTSESRHFPENTMVTYACDTGYRMQDAKRCNANWIVCKNGNWPAILPNCVEHNGCGRPPIVPYATVSRQDSAVPTTVMDGSYPEYPPYTKIHYKCLLPGFELLGSPDLICSLDGCWTPNPPQCIYVSPSSYGDSGDWSLHPPATSVSGSVDYNWSDSHLIVVSVATAGSIIGALLLIQVIVLVQRRKCFARRQRLRGHGHRNNRRSSPSSPDATTLPTQMPPNYDPDRVALIAFADGVQVVLPSYEEAIRQPGPPLFEAFTGIHRSRWNRGVLPSLPPTRRFRMSNSARDNSTETSSHGGPTRQSSSTSHSASVGDSIGSVDTAANSEVSTTITLDTLSSNASNISQTALSSRAINGSLASFDTCSIVNQEGVPLLEENEIESCDNEPLNVTERIDSTAPAMDCDQNGASG